MNLQCLRDLRYTLGLDFVNLYSREFGTSVPREDLVDRNALYSMYAIRTLCTLESHLLTAVGATIFSQLACGRSGHHCFKGGRVPVLLWYINDTSQLMTRLNGVEEEKLRLLAKHPQGSDEFRDPGALRANAE